MSVRAVVLLWLLVLLASPACRKGSSVEVAFEPRVPDAKQVAEQLEKDKSELGDYVPDQAALNTIAYLEKVNLLTATHERSLAMLNQAMQDLKLAASRCITDNGVPALRRLSLFLLARFETALAELAAAVRDERASTALLTGAKPPREIHDAYLKFAKVGGDFLLHAANAGLVRQSSQGKIEFIEGAPFFIRLAFKVRLANILPEATNPMDWLLSDFERKWYDVWVVERSRTASLARKLQALQRMIKRDPAYPAHLAHGIVFYQAKQYGRAVKAFHNALKEKPGDERIKKFLEAAESKAD